MNAYRKEVKTLGFLLDGPLRKLTQEPDTGIPPTVRVMCPVSQNDPEKYIFNSLTASDSKDTGRSRTAFLGKLG